MCFSAEASFIASAGLAVVGVASLARVEEPSDRMLAAIPLAFAAQQFVEGLVWSTPAGHDSHLLAARLFAFLAYAVWPIYVPLAFFRYEREPARKSWLLGLVGLGMLAGGYFLYRMLADPVEAVVRCGSLQYRFHNPHVYASHILYGIPVMLAPVLSREKLLQAFGAGLFVSYLIAYYAWFKTHPSVWCYFAALLSSLIYLHFRLRAAPSRL